MINVTYCTGVTTSLFYGGLIEGFVSSEYCHVMYAGGVVIGGKKAIQTNASITQVNCIHHWVYWPQNRLFSNTSKELAAIPREIHILTTNLCYFSFVSWGISVCYSWYLHRRHWLMDCVLYFLWRCKTWVIWRRVKIHGWGRRGVLARVVSWWRAAATPPPSLYCTCQTNIWCLSRGT